MKREIKLKNWSMLPARIKMQLDKLIDKIDNDYCFDTSYLKEVKKRITWFNTPSRLKELINYLINHQYPVENTRPSWTYLADSVEKLEQLVENYRCDRRIFTEEPDIPSIEVTEIKEDSFRVTIPNLSRTFKLHLEIDQTEPFFKDVVSGIYSLKADFNFNNDNVKSLIKPGAKILIRAKAYNNLKLKTKQKTISIPGDPIPVERFVVWYECPIEEDICEEDGRFNINEEYYVYVDEIVTDFTKRPIIGKYLYRDIELTEPYTTPNGIKMRIVFDAGGAVTDTLIGADGKILEFIDCSA